VNDFVKLQQIYEGYPGPFDPIKPSNYYPVRQGKPSYSSTPLGVPGGAENRYAAGMARGMKFGDEEVEAAEIINLDVLNKLDDLIDESDDAGMEYAVLQLLKLKEHIISLSQGIRD
tara:strand:+ start:1481 stop:1828 length:348 start_codon:yes stop_codon:yes gene_type:complete